MTPTNKDDISFNQNPIWFLKDNEKDERTSCQVVSAHTSKEQLILVDHAVSALF
jgi:hypothetical protein